MTLLNFPGGAVAAIDVRGGAAAVREQSCVDELSSFGTIDALVLAGGSSYGLEAASGVMRRILGERKFSTNFMDIPSVPSAIVYDFRGRTDHEYPDREMGERAFDLKKKNEIVFGRAGAGANIYVGKMLSHLSAERSGQGASFFEHQGMKFFAVTAVNALGNILDHSGQVIAGSLDPKTGQRVAIADYLMNSNPSTIEKGNTTISALVTNVKLQRLELKRLAIMVHTAMGRVIEPFHTPNDGDTLFVVSTDTFDMPAGFSTVQMGAIASRVMQNAVISSVKN